VIQDRSDSADQSSDQSELHVVIVTGDRALYDGSAERVVVPAIEGQISILRNHAPMFALLDPGELVVRDEDTEESFAIGGGFVEVLDNNVIVLADTAERAEEIDVARAETARRRAGALMKAYRGRPEYASAYQALRRSRARLQVAQRARSHSVPS
jgi:F-type H+-transporting ATPase subunit epsilon